MKIDDISDKDIRDIARLYVFKGEELAGTLTRTTNGAVFEYDQRYYENYKSAPLAAVGFSLPVTQRRFETMGDNLSPFFAGLLPEGRRLSALRTILKTSADDMFSLLAASGSDCIGDVAIALEPIFPTPPADPEIFKPGSIGFIELFERSIASPDYSWRLRDPSVPGIHPKISAQLISFPVTFARRRKRYLLKLDSIDYPKLVANEHFFMSMAKDCAVESAATTIVVDKNQQQGLLVERFDRIYDPEKKHIVRCHQEDACQFLGRYPQDKYRIGTRDIASGIQEFATAPLIELSKFIRLIAFSYIIGNGDLHAKNVSLLADTSRERVSLSPAYDLVSTLPYGDENMALQFEGRKDSLRGDYFTTFGEAFGLRPGVTAEILARLATSAAPWIQKIGNIGLPDRKTENLKRVITKRINDLKKS